MATPAMRTRAKGEAYWAASFDVGTEDDEEVLDAAEGHVNKRAAAAVQMFTY